MLGLQELLQELEEHQLEEDLVEVVVDVVAPSLVVDAQEGSSPNGASCHSL